MRRIADFRPRSRDVANVTDNRYRLINRVSDRRQ
jgi:hypothetical protein